MLIEGQHIGEFEILEHIGQGGMGSVFKARQTSLQRLVALKTLKPFMSDDPEYVARFRQEAVAAAALSHPNLVQVYAAGEAEGIHYFAMEYIEGESAQARLERKGQLDPLEAIAIGTHVAAALEHGWRKAALIHRDIKPDNIFLSEDGDVKLGDLGLAKSAGQTMGLTMTGASMGTPHYISPEQSEGMKGVDLRADIYSLGCTLYHLLSGVPPYKGDSAMAVMLKHISAPVPDIRGVWPECPAELAALVMKMMQKQPAERPQTHAEVGAELRRVYDHLTGTSVPEAVAVTPQQPAPHRSSTGKKALLYAGVGAGLLALAAGAFFLFKLKEQKPSGAAAQSVLSRATKDAPFVNTLGMKFVPVPNTKVLFSIWDTRVQDYAAYAKAQESAGKKVDGVWKVQQKDGVPCGREQDHPVVSVSWEDAQAFSAWLTEKETADGKLPKGVRYRLPSDEEWSWAVGLPPEVGNTPEEKHRKNAVDFPWGKEYPPTKKVGNYADESFHAKFPPKKNEMDGKMENEQWLKDYDDGYATTSPVGKFPANAYGLYDMGGNVWQWCEDWWNAEHKERVLRGASWDSGDRDRARSSRRFRAGPGYRNNRFGFRCVLAASGESPAAASAGKTGAAATAAEPRAIKLWDKPGSVPVAENQGWKDGALWLNRGSMVQRAPLSRDAKLRASIRMNPEAVNSQIRMRYHGTLREDSYYSLAVYMSDQSVQLRVRRATDDNDRLITKWPLSRRYDAHEWLGVELQVRGDEITALAEGKTLGTVHDPSVSEPGGVMLYCAGSGYFRDIEYVPLDGVSTSSEHWQDVLHDPAQLDLSGAVERTAEGLLFTEIGGALRGGGKGPKRDGALHVRATFGGLRPVLRARETYTGKYQLYVISDGKAIQLERWDIAANRGEPLARTPLPAPLRAGEDYELELRVVGQTLTVKFNGAVLTTVTDATFAKGDFSLGTFDSRGGSTLIKFLEVLDLDPAAPAERSAPAGGRRPVATPSSESVGADGAAPSKATQDAPFVNSLGMKFVAVPILSGPTANQRVLFSIWDTRVQDYAAFAGAKKVDDSWTKQSKEGVPAGRELNHPVVGVSWEEAQAFCQWLTEKEQAEGKLPKGLKYRLPSDEEWSWAVGLPPELGATPQEKSQKNSVDFPWGKDYPPTKKVGNYADEVFHAKCPKDYSDRTADRPWITGYDDGYATTSPVGKFSANAYGLYDISGNVYQWCEDWSDASHKDRVMRGAAWDQSYRQYLLSSFRHNSPPGIRNATSSFRCVIGESAR